MEKKSVTTSEHHITYRMSPHKLIKSKMVGRFVKTKEYPVGYRSKKGSPHQNYWRISVMVKSVRYVL
jgi:hypothetical protein